MGGGAKEQVVGNRYSFGQHLLTATNKLALLGLKYQDKDAWQGVRKAGQTIYINRPDLFGGDDREGGVAGLVDVLDGASDQPRNGYLQSVLARGAETPAFRYLSGLVFRRTYTGTNYYPKPPAVKVMDNQVFRAWEKDLGLIRRTLGISDAYIMICIESRASLIVDGKFDQAKAGIAAYIRALKGSVNSVEIHNGENTVQRIYNCTDANYEQLAVTVEGLTANVINYSLPSILNDYKIFAGFTPSANGVESPAFITNRLVSTPPGGGPGGDRLVIMVGSNFPATNAGTDVEWNSFVSAGMNPQWYAVRAPANPFPSGYTLDNTIREGTTNNEEFNVSTSAPEDLTNMMRNQLILWADLNPTHMFYDVITADLTHGNTRTELIGDTFAAAAQTLFNEGFGLSFYYRSDDPVREYISNIERHIDGRIYFDRNTGKFEINLIRNDYDINDLFTFDRTNVDQWGDDISDQLQYGLINRLVVIYRNQINGEKKAITVEDLTSIQENGGEIISDKVEYQGIYDDDLAVQVGNRDFNARNRPKWSGNFTASYSPPELNRGSAFIVNNPDLGINNVVCRVVSITRPSPTDRAINIEFVEDQFDIDDVVDTVITPFPIRTTNAEPAENRVVEEAPYYFLARQLGDVELETRLNEDNTIGYLQTAWGQPERFHLEATTLVNTGAGWDARGSSFPVTTKPLLTALTRDATDDVLNVPTIIGLENIRVGSLAYINGEYVRIDSVDDSGSTTLLTVGRGCIDTPPKEHPINTEVIFCGDLLDGQDIEYLDGEQIDVKLRTRTGSNELAINSAPTDAITFDQRAYRPNPVGKLQMNGDYDPEQLPVGTITLTWAHRDRTLQTTAVPQDFTSDSIGPEPDTTYDVSILATDDAGTVLATIETSTGILGTSYVVQDTDITATRPITATRYVFKTTTMRDGLSDRTSAEIHVPAFAAPINFMGARTTDVNLTWNDINSGSIQEDGFRLYRDITPFDAGSLPSVLVTLPPDTEVYNDDTAPDTVVYYMLETFKAGLPNKFTDLLTVSGVADRLLLESGDGILLESGDSLLAE